MAILTAIFLLRRFIYILIVGLFCSTFVQANEKSLQLYEEKIKAGIVYNLLKYTELPKDSLLLNNGKLQICLYGDDLFDGYLSPLEGRSVQQITITIASVKTTQEVEFCSVVIIHHNQIQHLPDLLPSVNKKHILTISDAKNFARAGGMVELSKENEKISLYINTQAVADAALHIQEPMLKLAKIVPPPSQER